MKRIYLRALYSTVKLNVRKWTNPENPAFVLCLFGLCPSMPPYSVLCKVAVAQPTLSDPDRQSVRLICRETSACQTRFSSSVGPGHCSSALRCAANVFSSKYFTRTQRKDVSTANSLVWVSAKTNCHSARWRGSRYSCKKSSMAGLTRVPGAMQSNVHFS